MKKPLQPAAAAVLGLAAAILLACALACTAHGRRSVSQAEARGALPGAENAAVLCINTADAADLAGLPGVGEVLAGRIAEYREAHGPFRSAEDLTRVDGIGDAAAGKIAPFINFAYEDGE